MVVTVLKHLRILCDFDNVFWGTQVRTQIYHIFSKTESIGFIFRTMVDKTIDKTIVNDCKKMKLIDLVLENHW
jgi:hypothetical protein